MSKKLQAAQVLQLAWGAQSRQKQANKIWAPTHSKVLSPLPPPLKLVSDHPIGVKNTSRRADMGMDSFNSPERVGQTLELAQ